MDGRRGSSIAVCLFAFLLCRDLAEAQSKVKDTEQRDYSIFVDGKEAGQSRMTLNVMDDDTTVMTGNVKVAIRKLVFTYSLRIDTTEWWKGGRLVRMTTSTTEDGKNTEVEARLEGGQLRVRVNGHEKAVNPESWVTSYWKLADSKFHNKKAPLLECDTGRDMVGDLKYVGTEPINIGSQPHNCYHFRVTGIENPIDLWFDRYHRLVRQEFTDSGHKTIVQLNGIKR